MDGQSQGLLLDLYNKNNSRIDDQEAKGIHFNKKCDPLPLSRTELDFRPRTNWLKEKPGAQKENSLTLLRVYIVIILLVFLQRKL